MTSNVESVRGGGFDVSSIDIVMKRTLPIDEETLAKIANETIKCDYNSKSITMGSKLTALMDILKNLQGQNIKINMIDCSKAALIVPEEQKENEEVTMLLMPMLTNN